MSAFWRSAPTLRFVSFAILTTGVFAFECARNSFTSALVYSRRTARLHCFLGHSLLLVFWNAFLTHTNTLTRLCDKNERRRRPLRLTATHELIDVVAQASWVAANIAVEVPLGIRTASKPWRGASQLKLRTVTTDASVCACRVLMPPASVSGLGAISACSQALRGASPLRLASYQTPR